MKSHRPQRPLRAPHSVLASTLLFMGLVWSLAALAGGTATNQVTDPGGGGAILTSSGNVTVIGENSAVSSAVAEIDPTTMQISSTGNGLTYDILPTINAGDTGVDEVTITAPAGYTLNSISAVSYDAGAGYGVRAANCPTPGAAEYCASIAGQTITVELGTKVTNATGDKHIQVVFDTDAPGSTGSANFSSTVDDTSTGSMAAQATSAGNADSDGADDNSYTVAVLPQVSFSTATQSGAESTGTLTLTAQLSAVSAQNVTVPYTLGGTATDPADYSITASPIVINAGDLSADITISVVDDALVESDETVIITMGAPINALAGATIVHTATITNNDTANVSLVESGGSTDVAETGPTSDSYTVVLDTEPTANVVITVTPDAQTDLGAGAATAINLTFTPGDWSTAQTVNVAAVDDATAEGAHTSTITHSAASGDPNYHLIAIANIVANVTDNDSAGVTVTQTGGNTNIAEGGAGDSYTIALTSEPTANVVITVTPDAQSDIGSGASNPINLTFTSGNWNIAQTINVGAVDDAVVEGAHSSTITHSVASADLNYNALPIANITAGIIDNDLAGVTLIESGGATNVTEFGATDTYTLVLNNAPSANVVISVSPDTQSDVGAGAGAPVNLTFTLGDWSVAQTITVTAVDDAVAEGAHTSTITHNATSADANYNAIAIPDATANITDNDTAQVGFSLATAGGAESVATIPVNVTLSIPSTQVITVDYSVNAATTASSGVDYTLAGGTLIFNAGETNKNITLTVTDDTLDELDETVIINLTNPTNAVLGATTQHTYTINDNDAPPSVTFAVATSAASESAATALLTVNLSTPSALPITVDYSLDASSTAAGGGVDYTLANGTLTFNPGETGQDITATIVDDTDIEIDETLVVNITNPVNATLGAITQHVFTINNDDHPNAVTAVVAEVAPSSVAVHSTGIPFTLHLLPTIVGDDSGFDRVMVDAPTGHANLTVTGVSVGGTALSESCPAPGSGAYCGAVGGQNITFNLGAHVIANSVVELRFSADAPNLAGSGTFSVKVDDSTTVTAPQDATAGDADGDASDGNTLQVSVVYGVDPLTSTVSVTPSIVIADGSATSQITATLMDTAGNPVPGKTVSFSSDRGAPDVITQPGAPSDALGMANGFISSTAIGMSTLTATDDSDGIVLAERPVVYFTQGRVLDITKTANKDEVVVGEVVTYQVILRNTTNKDVVQITLNDALPPNFKFIKGSARYNGSPLTDPAGNRTLAFTLGTLPAWVDSNANGQTDNNEPGFAALTYQLIVGAGATPRAYVNRAAAIDACAVCFISNTSEAEVTVTLDPLFDLGTLIGKVFEDTNRNGRQDEGEKGVAGAMVVLDNGSYVLTDEHGRYHFPAVTPGHRLLKINRQALETGAVVTSDEVVVVSVTPGLLAKANFGVLYEHDIETIGRSGKFGVIAQSDNGEKPSSVIGSVSTFTTLINGHPLSLPSNDVRLGVENLDDIVEITSEQLGLPLQLMITNGGDTPVSEWTLTVMNSTDTVVRTLSGQGDPGKAIVWDARTDAGDLLQGGEIYQYQLELRYSDGSRAVSARRMIGVNRSSAIAVNLSGGAFKFGSANLSAAARAALKDAATVLHQFPDEKVVIEGHADSLGSRTANRRFSRQRAETAAAYLVEVEGIARERLVVRWHGSEQPIASNAYPEGRELNRRVEIKGLVGKTQSAQLVDQFRTEPIVTVNGVAVPLRSSGHFLAQVDVSELQSFHLTMSDARGQSVDSDIPVPTVVLPSGELRLPFGAEDEQFGYRVAADDSEAIIMSYRLIGRTDPGNTVRLDGVPVFVTDDGHYALDLDLKRGRNLYGLAVRNPHGFTRVVDVRMNVSDRDANGDRMLMVTPVPHLTVKLPPEGTQLTSPLLIVTGSTAPSNTVTVNGQTATVQSDGRFTAPITMPTGRSELVVEATDTQGFSGAIRRDIEVTDTKMFILAFADGKFGQIQGKGYIQGAGMESSSEFYTEGRVAYYLKGVIAGKYLITSAFDSGTGDLSDMLSDLDQSGNDRLLTNLDPDKLYPVYGDSSTLVHDVQSQGKFYLAVESDELKAVAGNFPVSFSDTELAAYNRTLYGARVAYQSLSRSRYGQPDTQVAVFISQVSQLHVRDELRATGGSLYYLSHRDIIEGSEQISIVVRDKNTGLTVSRHPQQQNVDYTIKYNEGRLLFNRPISSTESDGLLVDAELLGGNPVSIEVDYETELGGFEQLAGGTRVRQQLGDHVAVGGTYVKDELNGGEYELTGTDVEVRLSQGTRLVAELAQSTGSDARTFRSNDGGLTYNEITSGSIEGGQAWKLAAEVDVGEWFGMANRLRAGGYLKRLEEGFISNGNSQEAATEKTGLYVNLQATARNKIMARMDTDETLGLSPSENTTSTLQVQHSAGRFDVTGEYQSKENQDSNGLQTNAASMAAELRARLTDSLSATAEQQITLEGADNDQTSLGLEYQLTNSLALHGKGVQGDRGHAAELGISFHRDGNRIYLTERMSQDRSGHGNLSTIFGGETPFGRKGKVYTEYQWENADQGDRNVSILGAQQQWQLKPGLQFLLSGETGVIDADAGDTSRYSLAAGLRYTHAAGLTATTRNELRREWGVQNLRQFLTTNHLELKLNPDYTLLGKYRYSITHDHQDDSIQARFEERSLGIAYRPIGHDRFNALARYTRQSDQRPLNLVGTNYDEMSQEVASVEWSYELTSKLEWVDKLAVRIREEQSADYPVRETTTFLNINRLNYRVRPRIELGAEYRLLSVDETNDQRHGWATELSWRVMEHMRVGGGYNFTDFSDNEFSTNDYTVHGWFLRLQGTY